MQRNRRGSTLVALAGVLVLAGMVLPVGAQTAQTATPEAAASLLVTARLGTGVEDRELVAEASTFMVGEQAYLWMKITGGPADPVTVTWSVGDVSVTGAAESGASAGIATYDVELAVGGPSWRTWSSKKLWKAGEWSVEVFDAAGTSLYRTTFTVESSRPHEDTSEGDPNFR